MLTEPTLRDRIKDRFRDMELDAITDMFRTEEIQRDIVSDTSQAVQQRYAALRLDARDEFQEIKADLSVQTTMLKQDLQDMIQAGRQWKSRVASRRWQGEPTTASTTSTTSTPPTSTTSASAGTSGLEHVRQSAIQHTIQGKIRAYEEVLRSPSLVNELNETITQHLSSANDMMEYYEARPELKEYTLTKEIPRMQYTVYTHTGRKLCTPTDIVEYDRQSTAAAAPEQDHDHDILWRAANQSLFGDVISCLTSETGLVRPQCSAATFVDDLSMVLDFGRDKPHVTGECFMNVSIPDADGERLSLAGVLVGVYFCPKLHKMLGRVVHISPSEYLTDKQVAGAAESLMGHDHHH